MKQRFKQIQPNGMSAMKTIFNSLRYIPATTFKPVLIGLVVVMSVCFLACDKDDKSQKEEIATTFSTTQVITGYTLPLSTSTIKSDVVTLTVHPKKLAATATLSIGGQNRATIHDIKRDATSGTIKFTVKGTSATPVTQPKGDTFVIAKDGAKELARANVVVVIPKAIATPHPRFSDSVTPFNKAIDATTSPAWFGTLQPEHVKLTTWYAHYMTVTVNDQFGKTLDKIYADTPVTEHANKPINQNMTAAGTYSDPVGSFRYPANSEVPKEVPDPNDPNKQIPNPIVTAFVNGPKLAIFIIDEVQNIPVQVGGHSLNPAVANRSVKTTTPDKLQIIWP